MRYTRESFGRVGFTIIRLSLYPFHFSLKEGHMLLCGQLSLGSHVTYREIVGFFLKYLIDILELLDISIIQEILDISL